MAWQEANCKTTAPDDSSRRELTDEQFDQTPYMYVHVPLAAHAARMSTIVPYVHALYVGISIGVIAPAGSFTRLVPSTVCGS